MIEPGVSPGSRSSGLLIHITSLPSRFGIGDLGPEAVSLIERLRGAGQRHWQLLPVGPTGYGNSPYQAASTFAGNPLLISPESIVVHGLADLGECDAVVEVDGPVDYAAVNQSKLSWLGRIAAEFPDRADPSQQQRYSGFCAEQGALWLDDYALFAALEAAHGGRPWTQWGDGLARRDPAALREARDRLADQLEIQRVIQFLFFDQWRAFRDTAKANGVELVGDLPLYVAHDSADVWANPDLFHLDEEGQPTLVAGVPPDYFSETGQMWGTPIYDWEEMEARDFAWWRARVRHHVGMFDRVRIDHFRGIAGYWAIPAGEPNAVNGRWEPGPGTALLEALRNDLGRLPFIAEDLGVITDDVVALRERFGLPGMRVAQFGFDRVDDSSLHHPDNFADDVWAYTGTHDNDTTKGWFWQDNPRQRVWRLRRPRRSLYRAVNGEIPWGLVEMVSRSRARTTMFPVQDILGLGSDARMNTPGTTTGNWEWRLRPGQLTDESLAELRRLTAGTGRLVGP